jgi:hypothetical protein
MNLCMCLQCATEIFLKNQESNSSNKLLYLLEFLGWCPWPASKTTIKQLRNHNFSVSKNRGYHQLYQAKVSQFRFESGSG